MRRATESEKVKPLKSEEPSKPQDRSKARNQPASQRFARPVKAPEAEVPEPNATTENVPRPLRAPLETPAPSPHDTFSPDGSEPPPTRLDSRDTPPPTDLDPETANTNAFGSIGRASRRQRGSVSYAEPNLRDKMRRPTKELTDAVGADERLQHNKTIKVEGEATEAEPVITGEAPSKMRTVTVKREPTADEGLDWRAIPMKKGESDRDTLRAEAPSPLGNKAPAAKADLPSSVVTERRRRPSTLERDKLTGEGGQQVSGAGSAIAALMTDNPKARSRETNASADKLKQTSKSSETPEVYEIQRSSPVDPDNATSKAREPKPAVGRSSRRHSSISDDRIKDAMARRAERRKEIAAKPDLQNVRSAATLAVESGVGLQGRGERAASRRRSMML